MAFLKLTTVKLARAFKTEDLQLFSIAMFRCPFPVRLITTRLQQGCQEFIFTILVK